MEIPDFYRGRSVLVTGGTGFIGKALVAKLLHCCPEVERVYLLIRAKSDVTPQQRLDALLALPIFAGCPIAKVTVVAGDVSLPGLGIGDEDRDVLASRVSVVLHSAATVNFTEPLRQAVPLNVEAAHHVVQLARDMKDLAALVHVSTAYSNCNRAVVREEVYPPPADVHDVIRMARTEDEDVLERNTPRIIGDRPNTYTFTKALAESLIVEQAKDLPLAIVRPSIVAWAWRDPAPGYSDNINGVMGPTVPIALGLVRSIVLDQEKVADVVPVDLVVNTILAVAWQTARQRPAPVTAEDSVGAVPRPPALPTVYNCATGARNPLRWGHLLCTWVDRSQERPPAKALWWPSCASTISRWRHSVRTFFTMLVPAVLHDHVVAPLLEKPAKMVRQQKKVIRLLDAFVFFTTSEWDFRDDNVRGLWAQLSGRDRVLFPLDVEAIDWDAYIKVALEGTKRHLLQEDGDLGGNPRRLYLLHRLAQMAMTSTLLAMVGWTLWPVLPKLWPTSTVKFIKFVLSKC